MTSKTATACVTSLAVAAGCFMFYSIRADIAGMGGSPSASIKTRKGPRDFDCSGPVPSTETRRMRPDDEVSTGRLLEQLAVLGEAGDSFDRTRFAALLEKLLQLDPDKAANFAVSLLPGNVREEALRSVAQGLASLDAVRAEKWAAGLSDVAERASTLANVCIQVAQTRGGEAVRMAERYQLGVPPGTLLESLVQQWAGQDFSTAADWALSRPTSDQREKICERLAIVLSATEPAEAARLVLKEIPEGSNQTEAVISVLYQWATRDFEGATAWVELFPAGPVRDRAESEISNIADYRVQKD